MMKFQLDRMGADTSRVDEEFKEIVRNNIT